MSTIDEPDHTRRSSDDVIAGRLWDLRQYTRIQIERVLQQALRDEVSPEEAARRVEALLSDDSPWAEAHRRLLSVSSGDALRSLLMLGKDHPEVRAVAADVRRESVDDDHPQASELEATIAGMLVDGLRADVELADLVQALAPPAPPGKRRPTPVGTRTASTGTQSPATSDTVGKARRAVDAKIKHRKGAWRVHCGNPMPGGCRGELGRFEDASHAGNDAYDDFPPEMRPAGRWVLRSDHGYGGNVEVGYTILREPKKSRRPLPERFGNVGGRLDFAGYWHGFVGQLPQPPCLVVCPLCGVPNHVGRPPMDS